LSQTVEFTADVRTLRQAIEAVAPHTRYSDELHECAPIRAYEAYLIAINHDSSLLRAKAGELMACRHMLLDPALRAAEAKADAIWENASANTDDTVRSLAAVVAAISGMPGQRLVLVTSSGFIAGGKEQELQALSSVALHHGVIVSGEGSVHRDAWRRCLHANVRARHEHTGNPGPNPRGGRQG
jgi:hypothetical protein